MTSAFKPERRFVISTRYLSAAYAAEVGASITAARMRPVTNRAARARRAERAGGSEAARARRRSAGRQSGNGMSDTPFMCAAAALVRGCLCLQEAASEAADTRRPTCCPLTFNRVPVVE